MVGVRVKQRVVAWGCSIGLPILLSCGRVGFDPEFRVEPACGDLKVDAAEECDTGGQSVRCEADCTLPRCGDGVVNQFAGEECDSAGESAGCDEDCSLPVCGDGTVNRSAGEICDAVGESSTCNQNCRAAACGDSVVNVEAGEECDTGGESGTCNSDCTLASCGDGKLNASAAEICDEGKETSDCSLNCAPSSCGDGMLDSAFGEQCDAAGESADCNVNCTDARCGDGILNRASGEECDAGEGSAACNADCTLSRCGDEKLNEAAGEQCDVGTESSDCDSDCTFAECGDGELNPSAGEDCDPGGMETPDCNLNCKDASCGDGVVNLSASEQCEPPGSAVCDGQCQHKKEALLVVGPGPDLDAPVEVRLEGLGYLVTQVTDGNLTPAELEPYALVVVSGSADGIPLSNKLRDTTRPVLLMEAQAFAGSGFGSLLTHPATSAIEVQHPHPLADGKSGRVEVWSSSISDQGLSRVSATLDVAVATSNAQATMVFGYEAGSQMASGIAPARRVGFTPGKRAHQLNSAGWGLFDAAVKWLVSAPVPIYKSCAQLMQRHPGLPDGLYTIQNGAVHDARQCRR